MTKIGDVTPTTKLQDNTSHEIEFRTLLSEIDQEEQELIEMFDNLIITEATKRIKEDLDKIKEALDED
jgi:hypothetical protein